MTISNVNHNSHLFCVAPMLQYTDRHARFFYQLLSQSARLYTEMIHCNAILKNMAAANNYLGFSPKKSKTAIQLAGNDPIALAECCYIAKEYSYNEINLNVGCPSPRVQSGCFGATLMLEPKLVAHCIEAMCQTKCAPISVKTRIGIDEHNDYNFIKQFVDIVSDAGCHTFILHARKAYLKGLSPKDNRSVPPLNYPFVYQLKEDFPKLKIIINGGIDNIDACKSHLKRVDGVMLGRMINRHPYLLAELEHALINKKANTLPDRLKIAGQYVSYVEKQLDKGTPYSVLIKPLLNLFHQQQNAKIWRQSLTNKSKDISPINTIKHSMKIMQEFTQDIKNT